MNLSEMRPNNFNPNNVDFADLKKRDKQTVLDFLSKYSVDISYDKLMKDFVDIYPFAENTPTVMRFRLMGIKITYDKLIEEEDSYKRTVQDPYSKKKSREQLLVLNKKKIDTMSVEEMEEVSLDCFEFGKAFEQLKLFEKILEIEDQIQGSGNIPHIQALLLKSKKD